MEMGKNLKHNEKGLKVKFWKGWQSRESWKLAMKHENPKWISSWHDAAWIAETNKYQLVVFKIPFDKHIDSADRDAIAAIEKLLQEKYPDI